MSGDGVVHVGVGAAPEPRAGAQEGGGLGRWGEVGHHAAGKDGLAFLTNGLGWAGLAFFQDKHAMLGWAGPGWAGLGRAGAQ